MKKFGLLLLLVGGMLWVQSCEQDASEDNTPQTAPELPPQESFLMPMPFAEYDQIDTSGFVSDGELQPRSGPATYRNWFYSGFNLVAWNVAVSLNLALPVASFAEAFNHNPTPLGDGVYAWTYAFDFLDRTYTATLTGQFINENEIEWIMRMSQSNGFTDVVWYEGIVSRDGRNAVWDSLPPARKSRALYPYRLC